MIAVKELRSGNYVWLPGIKLLHKICITDLYQGLNSECNPVMLSEEILLKCGFKLCDQEAFLGYESGTFPEYRINDFSIVFNDG